MHQFFVETIRSLNDPITLPDDVLRQIKTVLKLHPGETIWLSDGRQLVEGTIQTNDTVQPHRVLSTIRQRTPITMYAALIRKERFEWMLQKATELGVERIVPVIMERNVVKWEDEPKKMQRYIAILREAAEQCHRVDIPKLVSPVKLKKLTDQQPDLALVAFEHTEQTLPLATIPLKGASVGILIGPEGGISPSEMEWLRANGWIPVGLGPRTLRAETAALVALTTLNVRLES
jgi:16S rRNA (uracil1498-N3)-methyltransferase